MITKPRSFRFLLTFLVWSTQEGSFKIVFLFKHISLVWWRNKIHRMLKGTPEVLACVVMVCVASLTRVSLPSGCSALPSSLATRSWSPRCLPAASTPRLCLSAERSHPPLPGSRTGWVSRMRSDVEYSPVGEGLGMRDFWLYVWLRRVAVIVAHFTGLGLTLVIAILSRPGTSEYIYGVYACYANEDIITILIFTKADKPIKFTRL